MEVPNEEGEMAMPINSAYGHGHMIHHDPAPQNNHIIPSSQIITSKNGPPISSNKKMMKYKECLENHAAAMGGNATDGCGEFMPSGEEGINQEDGIINGGCGVMARPLNYQQLVKKRFRTKFSQEQKEKMLNFAEKIGWKMQKQEEAMVQQFCQQVGVKRRLLKVWMHNLAKKNSNDINTESQV
ncbi:zinc-finger homeodomain protein 4-like isoform X2 [Nicotiana tabacum]|uniref:Zinc-finger homeodomain protein 4-like isoform X2 n=2 Tax=Nicotiana TaxID=4085 RepID=A0AC58S3X8_TOBAC|nr:PREDICTED: zinc-finger homeodomain protein 3-like isoform X2 [Nicotiana sylvestris]